MNYDFMNNPIYPGRPMQQMPQNYQAMPFMTTPPPTMSPTTGIVADTSDSTTSSYGFTIIKDDDPAPAKNMMVPLPMPQQLMEQPKRRTRKKKEESSDGIVKTENSESVSGDVVASTPTIDTYNQTTCMLEEAIQQLDIVASELKEEMDAVRLNRNARNRTSAIANIGETLGRVLDSKISAIREINNSISKSNDMDYKKAKDFRDSQANLNNDDKHVMDLYNAMIHNPAAQANFQPMMPVALPSMGGEGIVRAPIVSNENAPKNGEPVDIGYLNYLARMSPEQNAMYYEHDPNVKNVVVFDHATGKKFFQVMNVATGQVIPNVPTIDQRFMDDTYLDMKTMTAKNSNMNQVYPIIEINKTVQSEY